MEGRYKLHDLHSFPPGTNMVSSTSMVSNKFMSKSRRLMNEQKLWPCVIRDFVSFSLLYPDPSDKIKVCKDSERSRVSIRTLIHF